MSDIAVRIGGARRTWAHEARATLSLAWPIILTNLAQTGMTATDVVLMGWLGPDRLAAGALASNLYFVFLIFGIGLLGATAAMVARELGRRFNSVRDVRRTVRQGLWSAAAITVPVWLVLWNAEPILVGLLGQDPALARRAAAYMHALQWSMLPFLCYIVLRSFVAALERPVWALLVGAVAIAVNAVLDWLLMFGALGLPRLELVGAGLATTICSTLMFLGLAAIVSRDRRFRRYRVFGRLWRADWPRLGQLWGLGLPIAAAVLFEVSIFNAAVFLMGLIGPASLAAHSIAIQLASLAFMVPMGFGQAATVRVGRAFGAGDVEAIGRAGWTAYVLGVGFMALTALAMVTIPRLLVGVFLDVRDPENAEVVALAVTFLGFAALFQIFDGAQAVGSGMLRGLHDTRVPMFIALFGYWGVGLPLGALLAFRFGLAGSGIWIGLASGLAVVALLMTARWVRRKRLGLTPRPAAVGRAVG
ncbi:MATE family efflux transporter [Propylenella binzhouense]|uniref:Multidrug-efflux transporter n=1 Tax=Propylenella binzhouense TaxID=2555902 RepID=A0A964T3T6_9HYPH|nr:MATE family efflux transporter [Propylenella binzhouense]MYZ47981.1 MATE family efflux transporter [Propylenella binzhouense]